MAKRYTYEKDHRCLSLFECSWREDSYQPTVSLNHEVLNLNSTEMSSWDRMGKSKKGVQGVNMWIAGENFLIIKDDDLSVAVPFFEKHLSSKFKP